MRKEAKCARPPFPPDPSPSHHFHFHPLSPPSSLAHAQFRAKALHDSGSIHAALAWASASALQIDLLTLGLAIAGITALLSLAALLLWPRPGRTFLVDFYCYRPPDSQQTTHDELVRGCEATGRYDAQAMAFIRKVMAISGLGQATFLPDAVRAGLDAPVQVNMALAREETERVLFACVAKVLARNGLKVRCSARRSVINLPRLHTHPSRSLALSLSRSLSPCLFPPPPHPTPPPFQPTDVDALIVNCTAFNPTPSLSAAVVNHFGMRKGVRTFSLHGMGCAASVIAIDLARDLLAAHPGMRIVVAGTENILWNLYFGNARSMLITNCIFRTGGVAYLLSNRRDDGRRAKYVLDHLVRTHLGGDDGAYNAVIQREDEAGVVGVKIGKELMATASKALEANLTALGPKVLPLSEKLAFAANLVGRKVLKLRGLKPYVPDFKTAFDHFAIHPGGKAVIDGVGKALGLTPRQCLPMLAPFERYGNTSSSSTWYAWSFIETEQGVKKGDKLWQLAFGSGFKCASATWTALRDCGEAHDAWTETPTEG